MQEVLQAHAIHRRQAAHEGIERLSQFGFSAKGQCGQLGSAPDNASFESDGGCSFHAMEIAVDFVKGKWLHLPGEPAALIAVNIQRHGHEVMKVTADMATGLP